MHYLPTWFSTVIYLGVIVLLKRTFGVVSCIQTQPPIQPMLQKAMSVLKYMAVVEV
jgi:hypothetical protein